MKVKQKKKNIPILNVIMLVLIFTVTLLCGCSSNIETQPKIVISDKFLTINLEEDISLPIMIDNENIYYVASNDSVSINSNIVTGINKGNTIIYGYNENDVVVVEYVVRVKDTLSHVKIKGTNYLEPNTSAMFEATITPSNLSQDVIWESSNEDVATVTSDGMVNAISEGLVTISATSKIHSTYKAEVVVLVAKKISESKDSTNIEKDENVKLNGDCLDSIFYPLIEEASSYVIGVNNYKKVLGVEKLYGIGSGIIYKRQIVLKSGETVDYDKSIDISLISNYKYYVVTNKHVILDNSSLSIYCSDIDYEIKANLIQYDTKIDLAVLTFETKVYFPVARFANSDNIKRAEFCIALGHPFGYELANTATYGIISHETRYLSADTDNDGINDWDAEYIQHDAAINEGNSGGPLINLKGEVIGINTLKISSVKIENMGFAIPSNIVLELIEYLEKGVQPQRPTLGVQALEVKTIIISESLLEQYPVPSTINYGIYVSEVNNGGVAESAGIKPGDIILSINDVNIYYTYLLRAELNKFIIGSGQTCKIVVYRNNELLTLTATF